MKKSRRVRFKPRFYVIMIALMICLIALCVGALRNLAAKNSGAESKNTPSAKTSKTSTDALIDNKIKSMSDRQKVMQMFIVTPEALTDTSGYTSAGEMTKEKLQSRQVGGVIFFAANLVTQDQTKTMIDNLQTYAKDASGIPLFISVDEEGGPVARCAQKLSTAKLNAMYTYKDQGTDTAEKNAETIAKSIGALGFNLDYAPVADTWTNPANTVIGKRAYSDNYDQDAELVAAAVKGFHNGDMACTLKHFPGHGDTSQDSHKGDVTISKTYDELEKTDLIPFRSGIKAGADMVMVSHIIDNKITDQPASLSREMVTDILRKKMGYKGVIITDDLSMGAVSQHHTPSEAAVDAVKAGNDVLLGVTDIDNSADAVVNAVKNGEISEKQINASVRRILKLKAERGIYNVK